MIKKIKENKKGFTLVELIVVLVILAILAALLVPALTGYIDRAKKKSIIAETRQCVMAAQTLVDEAYATVVEETAITVGEKGTVKTADVVKLAEVKGTLGSVTLTTTDTDDAVNKIKTLEYTKGNLKCTYSKGDYTVAAATASSDGN